MFGHFVPLSSTPEVVRSSGVALPSPETTRTAGGRGAGRSAAERGSTRGGGTGREADRGGGDEFEAGRGEIVSGRSLSGRGKSAALAGERLFPPSPRPPACPPRPHPRAGLTS